MTGFLNRLDAFEVSIAQTPSQFGRAMAIRRRVYVDEMRWRKRQDLVDSWDALAVHFVVNLNGHAIASGRMVPETVTFEGECCFEIADIRSQGPVCEIGRMCVLAEHRRSLAAIALFRGFYRYSLAHGARFFFVTGAHHVDRLYRSLGFSVIGGPTWYEPCGYIAKAYVLDLNAALGDWAKRRPRMLEYFLQPIEGIG
jgi:N-acyl-L-homoserine lactone synthetase